MGRINQRKKLTGSALSSRVAQWTQPGFVKRVQRGTIAITGGGTSNTATIDSVDTSNARLRLIGHVFNNTGTAGAAQPRIALTNATTITATVATAPGADTATVGFEVTEYYPGAIKSVQRGTIATNGTATINTVDTSKSELDWLGTEDGAAAISFIYWARVALTNATTVTAFPGTVSAQVTGYQVVEFY